MKQLNIIQEATIKTYVSHDGTSMEDNHDKAVIAFVETNVKDDQFYNLDSYHDDGFYNTEVTVFEEVKLKGSKED